MVNTKITFNCKLCTKLVRAMGEWEKRNAAKPFCLILHHLRSRIVTASLSLSHAAPIFLYLLLNFVHCQALRLIVTMQSINLRVKYMKCFLIMSTRRRRRRRQHRHKPLLMRKSTMRFIDNAKVYKQYERHQFRRLVFLFWFFNHFFSSLQFFPLHSLIFPDVPVIPSPI